MTELIGVATDALNLYALLKANNPDAFDDFEAWIVDGGFLNLKMDGMNVTLYDECLSVEEEMFDPSEYGYDVAEILESYRAAHMKFEDVCELLDWSVQEDGDEWCISKKSPAGEDFSFNVSRATPVKDLKQYAEDFDPDEHAEMWVMARKEGVQNVPSIGILVNDALSIHRDLHKLAGLFRNDKDDTDC